MKYIPLLTMLCFVTVSYAAENKYYHISNAINSSLDIAEEQKELFAKIQQVIYQKSSHEDIAKLPLKRLTIIQLSDLIKHIGCRVKALKKIADFDSKQQRDIDEETKRLLQLRGIIASERGRWADFFTYDPHANIKKHTYIYCANRHSVDMPKHLRISIVGAPRNVSESNDS